MQFLLKQLEKGRKLNKEIATSIVWASYLGEVRRGGMDSKLV